MSVVYDVYGVYAHTMEPMEIRGQSWGSFSPA